MNPRRRLLLGAAALALPSRRAAAAPPIRLAYLDAWPCSRITTHLLATLIRTRLQRTVQLLSVDMGPMWAALAAGRADVTVTAWLPRTSGAYMSRYHATLVDAGVITRGTWAGLAVPDYMPVRSIDELVPLQSCFGRQIIGIEPGAWVMERARVAIDAYGLRDTRLLPSSTAGMLAQLKRMAQRHEAIVITAWKPLGIWAELALRQLEDPRGIFGDGDDIHAVAHIGLREYAPDVWRLLQTFRLPLDDLQAMMVAVDTGESLQHVIDGWIATRRVPPPRV